jgi:hypothetical protein
MIIKQKPKTRKEKKNKKQRVRQELTRSQAPWWTQMWVWSENNERARSWGKFFSSQHFRGGGACWSSEMGLGIMTSTYSLTQICTNQTTNWLVHSLNTFGVRMNHEQTRIHKTHHNPDLGGSHHLPLCSILCASPRSPHPNGILSWDFQMEVLKFLKLGLSQFWGLITLCANLWSRWDLKQSCSPRRKLFNSMLPTTYTRGNRGDSQLLVVQMGHASPFQTSTFQ